MTDRSGRQTLYAAALVAVAVIAGSLVVADSLGRVTARLDQTTRRLDSLQRAVADAKDALGRLAETAQPAKPAARRGPDPDRRYELASGGSPSLGPAGAAVEIVEFADFQ